MKKSILLLVVFFVSSVLLNAKEGRETVSSSQAKLLQLDDKKSEEGKHCTAKEILLNGKEALIILAAVSFSNSIVGKLEEMGFINN